MLCRHALSPVPTKQAADCPVSCCFEFVVSWKPRAGTRTPKAEAVSHGLENGERFFSRLRRIGKTNSLADNGLIMQQIRQRHSIEYVVDLLLQEHPHRSNAAQVRSGAAIRLDWMGDAVKIESLQLRRLNYFTNGRFSRRPGERIPATSSASARDHSSPTKSQ